MKQHDKDKLSKLNIDYFKDEVNTISLNRTKGLFIDLLLFTDMCCVYDNIFLQINLSFYLKV